MCITEQKRTELTFEYTVLRTGSAEDRLRCPEQFDVLNFANLYYIQPPQRPCPETVSFGRAVPKTGPVARNSLKP